MSSGAPKSSASGPSFSRRACNALLPLVRSIAAELIERREIYGILVRRQRELGRASTPEGLTSALENLEACLWEQESGILRACRELTQHGLALQTLNPIVVHFPARDQSTVHCWREDEPSITHQHGRGTESDPECTAVPHDTPHPGRAEE